MAKKPAKKAGTAGKITLEELHRKMADPRTSKTSLRKYFRVNELTSDTFKPALELNPDTVIIPPGPEGRARGDVAVASLNWWSRMRRLSRFNSKLAAGYDGPIVVSEGDSWFQYPLLLEDTIDQLDAMGYAIRSLGAAGDTLDNMIAKPEYIDALRQTGASIFLFSAGGNDVLGGGHLADHLLQFDPTKSAVQHILPSFNGLVAKAISGYDTVLRSVEALPGDVQIFCHGYDYVFPNAGKWLGKPMASRGIKDKPFQRLITSELINRFNTRLKALLEGFPNAHYIDARGAVADKISAWHDELHPKDAGYKAVAKRFDAAIKVAQPRSFAAQPDPAARGSRDARAIARNAPRAREGGTARTGLSLHVGLNHIDPNHYGSDGALTACISDAEAMEAIARSQGYEVMDILRDGQGTRDAVMGTIREASRKLKSGDIFMFTYAGHGSQMADFNGDEPDDRLDETWCLFDAMMLDDEAYELWCGFEEGVRVLCVLDCCHSGTAIRMAPGMFPGADNSDASGVKPRMLPISVAQRAFRANPELYRRIGSRPGGEGTLLADDIAMRPQRATVRCSVRLLSGCQDNQVSMDGFFNGRFTEELLKVWNDGRFRGDYHSFHRTIVNGMPPTQTPNHFKVGAENPAFDGQMPFLI
ncbi:MAG: caspase family protein [Brucellaceae bacterium]|nr:caspase family protein [Brucellaceae bacterium]